MRSSSGPMTALLSRFWLRSIVRLKGKKLKHRCLETGRRLPNEREDEGRPEAILGLVEFENREDEILLVFALVGKGDAPTGEMGATMHPLIVAPDHPIAGHLRESAEHCG